MPALNALLAGLVDFAGLFPPAGLDRTSAVRAYAAYRQGPHASMLGSFGDLNGLDGGIQVVFWQKALAIRAQRSHFACPPSLNMAGKQELKNGWCHHKWRGEIEALFRSG